LNVTYSWGGIYDHPLESLFLSVGAFVFAVIGSGMTLRESMLFSAFSSAKACTDHGGYKFPWNPMDLFTTVGAAYHDKHHQLWGSKVIPFSFPFLPFFLI
jgi:sphinganine C4-monooxygenase